MRRSAVCVLLMVVLGGCSGGPAPGSPEATSVPTAIPPSPVTSPQQAQALPVYYVGETPAGYKLYREFHRVTTSDPASDAVREMLAAPTGTDPDYRSHWPKGTSLRTHVAVAAGVITVDLTGVGAADVGTELAAVTVQQLVYTVQGTLQSSDPVRILVDGKPVAELWGAVATADPVARGDIYKLRSSIQIDAPADGATVSRQFEVSGEASVFEGTVHWEVRRGNAVLRSGFTGSAGGMLTFGGYRFPLELEPGEYTVRVIADDPTGGQGIPPASDDKAITVTA